MKHFVKDLNEWGFNLEEISKRINILDLAGYLLNVHQEDNQYYAGIQDWDTIKDRKKIIYFNKEENSFTYNDKKGGPLELFDFLCPYGDLFVFIKKVFNLDKNNFLEYAVFKDEEKIVFDKYPINLDEYFEDKESFDKEGF